MVDASQAEFCRVWGQLVKRSWRDEAFRARLVRDPEAVLAEHGFELPPDATVDLTVVAGDSNTVYLYLPCPEELDEKSAHGAGRVARECPNNRLELARLTDATLQG